MICIQNYNPNKLYEYISCKILGGKIWNECTITERRGFTNDVGIDGLIIEYNKDKDIKSISAIQVKNYSTTSITHTRLSTFVSFTKCKFPDVNRLIVVTPEVNLSYNAKKIYDNIIEFVVITWREIYDYITMHNSKYSSYSITSMDEDINLLCDSIEHTTIQDITINDNSINKNISYSKINSKIKLRDYQIKLLSEINKFMESDKQTYRVNMAVGMGKTTMICELCENTLLKICIVVPLISIAEQISDNLNNRNVQHTKVYTNNTHKLHHDNNIYICVDNSSELLQDIAFDLVIYDECHHSYNNSKSLNTKKKLELSASIYTDVDFMVDINYGIANGYLSDYNVIIIVQSNSDKYKLLSDKIIDNPEFERCLCFFNSIDSILNAEKIFKERNIQYRLIIGTTSNKDRLVILDEFISGSIKYIFSIRCLSEGIDIPIAKTCVFYDIPNTGSSIIQRMGRVLRKHEDKNISFIVLCVNSSSINDKIIDNEFEKFMRIITKLDGSRYNISKRKSILETENTDNTDNTKNIEKIYYNCGMYYVNKAKTCIEYVEKFNKMPNNGEKYNGVNIIKFINKIKSNGMQDIIELFRKNDIIKNYLDSMVVVSKSKKSTQSLLQYVEKYNKLPDENEVYNGHKIGKLYNRLRYVNTKRIELLSNTTFMKLYKEDKMNVALNVCNRITKFDMTLLQDFIKKENRLPLFNDTYKEKNIGEIYSKVFSKNNAKHFNTLMKLQLFKDSNKDAEINKSQKFNIELILEFVNKYNRIPNHREKYKKIKIRKIYNNFRNNKMPIELLNNEIIKNDFEKFLRKHN